MPDRINISFCANAIASALLNGMKAGNASRIDIDCVRAAVIGYLAAGPTILSSSDTKALIDTSLRKLVEKVG